MTATRGSRRDDDLGDARRRRGRDLQRADDRSGAEQLVADAASSPRRRMWAPRGAGARTTEIRPSESASPPAVSSNGTIALAAVGRRATPS